MLSDELISWKYEIHNGIMIVHGFSGDTGDLTKTLRAALRHKRQDRIIFNLQPCTKFSKVFEPPLSFDMGRGTVSFTLRQIGRRVVPC